MTRGVCVSLPNTYNRTIWRMALMRKFGNTAISLHSKRNSNNRENANCVNYVKTHFRRYFAGMRSREAGMISPMGCRSAHALACLCGIVD